MRYGKLDNGHLDYAPSVLIYNDKQYINPTDEILRAAGYMPIEVPDAPKVEDGYENKLNWNVIDGAIVAYWTQELIPESVDEVAELRSRIDTLTEQLNDQLDLNNMLLECVLEMSEYVYA